MDRCVGAAARLPESDRKDLAVQALARSATVSDLSSRHGVSRKFVYQQANKARRALDDAFSSADADDEVLFEIAVTRRWLRQVIVALALMCRGSYLGIIEFMRDLLGISISPGTVHTVLNSAAERAGVINRGAWFRIGHFLVTNGRTEAAGVAGRILVGWVIVRGRRPASPVQARWF